MSVEYVFGRIITSTAKFSAGNDKFGVIWNAASAPLMDHEYIAVAVPDNNWSIFMNHQQLQYLNCILTIQTLMLNL